MSETLQLHQIAAKETKNQPVLNELPHVLVQEKYKSLVASRVSDLQSALPIQKNSTEGKKSYESKNDYGWLRYAIQPFDTTPEYKKWKSSFDVLKKGFIDTKKELLDKESTLFANKAELAAIDVKLSFIDKRRKELISVSGGAKEKELNDLKEIETRLKDAQTQKTDSYNISEQEKAILDLKQKLVSGEDIGYEKIITHINTKPQLVKEHYNSQQSSIQGKVQEWNAKNLADVSNPSYKELHDHLVIIQDQIGEYNKDIVSRKTETQNSARKIHQENMSISNAITAKYISFADYFNTNLLIKGYGGLDKESDRARASLQYHVYDLMLGDLQEESLSFIDDFYTTERSTHLSKSVAYSMDGAGMMYLDNTDPQAKGLEGVKVIGASGAFISRKTQLYQNMRDFYDSTYNKSISSDSRKSDPIGLQSEITAIDGVNNIYISYKTSNDRIGGIITTIKGVAKIAQEYEQYVYDFTDFESKDIQRDYLSRVSEFVSPLYKNSNLELSTANSTIEELQPKVVDLKKLKKELDSKYPSIVLMIEKRKSPSTDQENKQFREYKDGLREIEQQGLVLIKLRDAEQKRDANIELARNLKPISDAYSTAFNAYKKPVKPDFTQIYTGVKYPLQVGSLVSTAPVATIDFASILDYVNQETDSEKDK